MDTLASEVKLELEVPASQEGPLPLSEALFVFLTGASGFLGAFLLYELLTKTKANVCCLVRAENKVAGAKKIHRQLISAGCWQAGFQDRIKPILGDLQEVGFGLPEKDFEALATKVDVIFHCAAALNFLSSYKALKPINVGGTREIIRLAVRGRPKPLHYVSTVSVFESSVYAGKTVDESDLAGHTENMVMGYSQTKWVAERTVQLAGKQGLPISIYRMPLISGHSQTGFSNTNDFVSRMIKGTIQVGYAADLDIALEICPVDYISRAIVYLADKSNPINSIYHLCSPTQLDWDDLLTELAAFGYLLEKIPYPEWQQQLVKMKNREQTAIYPLLPFVLRKWTEEKLTLLELYQKHNRPKIDCAKTAGLLAGDNIFCPPADRKLMKRYITTWISSGFLERMNA